MKRVSIWVMAVLGMLLLAAACGDTGDTPDDSSDALSAAESAKISADLLEALESQREVTILVQANPQVIFRETFGDRADEWLNDPAVIWKARQEGAVIWKFTPEQAVIWKTRQEGAVIWKLVDKFAAAGYDIDEAYESIHLVKMPADLATVRALARMDDVFYLTPDRAMEVSALSLTNATLGMDDVATRQTAYNFNGLTGAGVGVAVIDSGLSTAQGDFTNGSASRVVAVKNFTTEGGLYNVSDLYGHGTHVAGLLAGNGAVSYNNGYDVTFEGIAPEASLVIAKVLDVNGSGAISGAVSALEWVLSIKTTYNIRVVNMSVGLPPLDPWANDPLCQAVQNAVANGLVVVTAAGNYGYKNGKTLYGTIASPAIAPSAVSVGASTSRDTVLRQQDQYGFNDKVAFFSSRGPTAWNGLAKPDLLAPGLAIISAYAANSTLGALYPQNKIDPCAYGGTPCGTAYAKYFQMSGTSMAAPLAAGTAVLMLEANPSLTPNAVKALLMVSSEALFPETVPASCYTNVNWRENPAQCTPLLMIEQGSGLLNVPGATLIADAVRGDTFTLTGGTPWIDGEPVDPVSFYSGTGDGVIWSQGLAWTGITVWDVGLYETFQTPYRSDQIWGQGLAWTGIREGEDPVFTPWIMAIWTANFANPFTIAGTNRVLGGYSYDWDGPVENGQEGDPFFPEQ